MTVRTAAELATLPRMPALGRPLTPGQRTLLRLVAEGRTNGEVGARLYLAEGTVKAQLRRIMAKLGAPNRAAAVHRAWQLGVLS